MSEHASLDSKPNSNETATVSVTGQLAYLIEEIEAQRPLFARIREEILSECPLGPGSSLKDRYLKMLHREEHINTVVLKGLIDRSMCDESVDDLISTDFTTETPEDATLGEIQSRIADLRQNNVNLLPNATSSDWNLSVIEGSQRRTLLEWAFKMALEDADTLREVSLQLSEIQLLFRH